MKLHTLGRIGVLLFLLLSNALPIDGLVPTTQSEAQHGKIERPPVDGPASAASPASRGGLMRPAAMAFPLPSPVRLTPTRTPTVPSPTPTAIRAPVYVPLDEPPTPPDVAELCDEPHGQISVHTFYSESLRRQMRYRIYLPPCYAQTGRLLPVLYMFHGLNYGDSQWDTIGLDELADAGIVAGDMPPFIIVMPNIWGIDRQPDGGAGSVEQALVEDLLPHVERRYCAWNKRAGRAIGGLSRGAFWALEIAFRHPDLFASVGGHSPAVFWDNALPEYNPYYLVDEAPGLESLRILLDVGEQDWLNKWVTKFRERLDERGLAYRFATAPGDHAYAYWRAQAQTYLEFYAAGWPSTWHELPTPPDCIVNPKAPGCRNGLGPGRPCDVALP